jgi:cobalt/nickel transport system ATP-binding protein
MNPEVLVFDEPLNGLDPRTKKFVRDLMVKMNASGKTIICATHDFEQIKGVFKRILILSENNKVVFTGDYEKAVNDEDFLTKNNLK